MIDATTKARRKAERYAFLMTDAELSAALVQRFDLDDPWQALQLEAFEAETSRRRGLGVRAAEDEADWRAAHRPRRGAARGFLD